MGLPLFAGGCNCAELTVPSYIFRNMIAGNMFLPNRISFGLRMARKTAARQPMDCPYCGHDGTRLVAIKKVLLQLRECERCHLNFRYPKDNWVENFDYYQEEYEQQRVTDLPPEADLPRHISNNFRHVGRDLTEHLQVIARNASGRRLLDFGASWGYCSWQFQRAGYETVGFDISRTRTKYGEARLGVPMVSDTSTLPARSIEIIYAAHVLEHMPDPGKVLREFRRLLKPGGKLFIFVPNGGCKAARSLGVQWPPLINQKHVMAFTARFFDYSLAAEGFAPMFASSPYDTAPRRYDHGLYHDGEELLAMGT